MDIEGSEEQILASSIPKWLGIVNVLFLEIHENLKPGLTKKIESNLIRNFHSITHGEYHVFTRKIRKK